MMKNRTRNLLAGAAIAAFAFSTANAALLVYEDFDYATTANLVGTAATGTGLDGTWARSDTGTMEIKSGSLDVGSLSTSGNHAFFTNTANRETFNVGFTSAVQTALTPANGETVEYWYSFTFSTPNSAFDTTVGTSGNSVRVGGDVLANSGGASAGLVDNDGPADLTNNTNYFLLAKVSLVDDAFSTNYTPTITTWTYDATDGIPTTAPTTGGVTATATPQNAFTSLPVEFRVFTVGGSSSYAVDEFRLGESFGDVSVIPEPSTIALVVLSLGAVVLFRRRR